MRATRRCRSGNSATRVFYIGPNVIECTTPWHEVSRLVELGIGSSESKDVSIIEFLNPFELSSIPSDSGSGGEFPIGSDRKMHVDMADSTTYIANTNSNPYSVYLDSASCSLYCLWLIILTTRCC